MTLHHFLLLSSLSLSSWMVSADYKMDHLITCLEQNDESPYGYKDKVWNNRSSDECLEYPDLCEKYINDEPFAGRGDVCDHTDPRSGNVRNSCKMAVMFGKVEDAEKTWSWKCWDLDQCPVKNTEGNGIAGCLITEKRIQCCCQEDFCTSDPLYAAYAAYGRADHYPPNIDDIIAIEHGDVIVVVQIDESYEYEGSDEESGDDDFQQEDALPGAHSVHMPIQAEETEAVNGTASVADMLLIFTYFALGTMCMGLGVFVGAKWKRKVSLKEPHQVVYEDDI